MKRKSIVIIVLLLVLCLAYWYFKNVYGWMEFRKNTDTPKEFLSHVVIKKEDYSKDSLEIIRQLKSFVKRHEGFFHSKEYFESTQLIIDSIIYSPEFNKLAVLVITKNPTYRQRMPDKNHEWYYDANCYLGIKQNDTISLSSIGPIFSNSYDKENISNDIREACFRTFVTKDTIGPYTHKYNLNDIRFWKCSIWGKIETEKLKKKEFEEEKKNHPENVYEPNNKK